MSTPKKVVIFNANGGIGQATVQALTHKLSEHGNESTPVEIYLSARAGAKGNNNRAAGIAREVRESQALESKVDLDRALAPENQIIWNIDSPQEMERALKDADVIIIPGGLPRKRKANGSFPERSELIAPNAEMIEPIAEAIARYAPPQTPVITCTNPLDNMVTVIEETCHRIWDQNGIPAEDRPEHKVVGMGGTLDETRAKQFICKELKAHLDAIGEYDASQPLLPSQIEAYVYGQHGPNMVIDTETIRVRGISLDEFLEQHGLSDKKSEILDAVIKNTKTAGGKMEEELDRTAQESPGQRLAEITAAILFSPQPYGLTAAVHHQLEDEERAIASGCRVEVSSGGITRLPYDVSANTMQAIKNSRDTIANDQNRHEAAAQLHEQVMKGLANADIRQSGDTLTITLRGSNREGVEDFAKLLERKLELQEGALAPTRIGQVPSIAVTSNDNRFIELVKKAGAAIVPEQLGVA